MDDSAINGLWWSNFVIESESIFLLLLILFGRGLLKCTIGVRVY
jgi:hypothetical protein